MFSSPDQLVRRYYDLFNARALDETEQLIAPDALFHYPSLNQDLVGRAAHRSLSALWLAAFPDLHLELLRASVSSENVVVARSMARGTHRGVFRLGDIAVPPTENRFVLEFQHTFEVREGRITDVTLQLNLQEFLRHLQATG